MTLASKLAHENPQGRLRSLFYSHYTFQYLAAASEFGLFGLLAREPGLSRTEIAARLEIQDQPARILLEGCVASELLRNDHDGYYNTPVSELLTGNPEETPAAFIPWELHVNYRPMAWFYESLKENTNIGLQREVPGTSPTLYGRLAGDPRLESTFHNMMGSVTREAAPALVEADDFSKFTHILDIGGGAAVNAEHFARRWPHLQITIIDLPTIAEAANAKMASLGLSDRVRAVGLDAFNDEFPVGCDCVLFAHFLEIWSADKNRALLTKASRAVKPGAGIFVVTPGQDEETGPELAAALSAYFHAVASGEGMVYSPADYEEWFAETGFRPTGQARIGGLGDIVLSGVRL